MVQVIKRSCCQDRFGIKYCCVVIEDGYVYPERCFDSESERESYIRGVKP
jgi:hypothetical protein